MAEERFPSGPWTGFYNYRGPHGRYRMDIHLTFANGLMTGSGSDAIGPFVFNGSYDPASGEVSWAKQYLGRHTVDYTGYREGKGIWGTWRIRGWSGGFHIWPVGSNSDDALSEAKEETDTNPVAAPIPPQPAFSRQSVHCSRENLSCPS